jgi:polar amino acid transport system substrate-binding protein
MHLQCRVLLQLACAAAVLVMSFAARAETESALRELAPTGKLRVALFTLPIVAVRDAETGQFSGVAADLGRDLATKLGVAATFTAVKTPSEAVDQVANGFADITFLVDLSARSAQIDFGAAYIGYETTFLVPENSMIRSLDDINGPGRRIIAPEKSAISTEVARAFKDVTIVGVPIAIGASDRVIEMLRNGEADGYTNLTHLLSLTQRQLPGWRIVPGSYMTALFSIAYPKDKPTGASYANRFVHDMKKNGFIQKAIERAELKGAIVPE